MVSIVQAWQKIISTGIDESTSFEERKITRLLNIFVSFSIPTSFIFSIINFSKGLVPLAALNISVTLGGVLILLINKYKRFAAARIIISMLGIGVFTASALLYNNGGEYFLLVNILATIVLFRKRYQVILFSVINAVVFLYIKYALTLQPQVAELSYWRVLFNISWALAFIILGLHYFKKEHQQYQQKVEAANQQLQQQQIQLLQQKEELERKSEELYQLNKTKEKLFSVIAHDMRSPIGSLKGLLDLLSNKSITKEEFDALAEQLTSQVDHLYNTLDNLLQWSHTQMRGIHAKPHNVHLKALVNKCIKLLSHEAQAKQLTITHHLQDDLMVYADPNQLKVVIRNLLSNAIKFSFHEGTIEISTEKRENEIVLFVKDYGTGMNQLQVANLFGTTIQSARGTANEKGTGLGLTLCKDFITKNNGSIAVESEPGKGSTFIIAIPAAA